MGGVQVLPGCCILHQNYERYIRVIFMLSYVATIQPKEEGRKTSPLVVWSLRMGMMKNTGVFFIIWLYGVYVRSIFHLLVVWSVRTGMMKNTEVFFIRWWILLEYFSSSPYVHSIQPDDVWRLRTQIRILPVRSLNTAGGEKYSSSMLRRLRRLRWESDYRVCRSVISNHTPLQGVT